MRSLRFNLNNTTIVDLYVNHKQGKEAIAQQFGVDPSVIHRRLLTSGVKLRTRQEVAQLACGKVFNKDVPEIVKLYEEGQTLAEIAMKYKVTLETIAKRLRMLNKIRTPAETLVMRGTNIGEKNPKWKGGRWKNADGYIQIYEPNVRSHYVLEHILVWEEYHGKKLSKGYIIHHLNGIKSDNRPQNLVAMKKGEHIHQAEPFKKKIRELEIENRQLRQAFEKSQSIFYIGEN